MTEVSRITDDMRAIVGKVLRRSVSFPIDASDIRRWAVAVYYPETPPRIFWDEAYAAETRFGGIVAPEEFNPFAWMTRRPEPHAPTVAQTAFSEAELGVTPPICRAMLLTEIRSRYGSVRMRPGDVVHGVHRIVEYTEREGRMGWMLYTTVAHELYNQDDEWIRTTESVFARY